MNKKTLLFVIANILILNIGVATIFVGNSYSHKKQAESQIEIVTPEPIPIIQPITNNVTNTEFVHLSYEQTVSQLKKWADQAPDMADIGIYGKSTKGNDLYYIRINNKRIPSKEKPKVLITACIHGNEPLAAGTVMAYINELLLKYNTDQDMKDLLNTRDIYFVPIVSPDSYTKTREVDGVDPNRNFAHSNIATESVAPVAAIQELFTTIKPNAVISTHTWGRVFLIPYGDTMENSPHHKDFVSVVTEMGRLSGYKYMRVCDLYKNNGGLNIMPRRKTSSGQTVLMPIFGTEVDWYYRNGSFPIVMEVGTHQRIPTTPEIQDEYRRTWTAFLYFIKEAPMVNLKWDISN